jgi:drug/metabolite transporter (DMT)-like permease
MGAQPIFVFLFGRFLGSSDRWTRLAAFGLALGFVGVGVAFWSPGADSGAHSILGRAFALAAGVFYGTGAIISGAATREIGAVRAVTASMTISTLVLALIGLAFGKLPPLAMALHPPLAPTLAMGALGVFNTALAYYVYFRLVNEEGPTFASLNNYIVPLIGVIGGAVALAEPIAPAAWEGLALVLVGVALTGRSLQPAKAH